MLLIELEVVPKATSGFFDIRSCLIKGQGKAIEGNRHIRGLVALLIRGALVLRTMEQNARPFHQTHLFHLKSHGKRADGIRTCGQQNTSLALEWNVLLNLSNSVGVVN